MPLKMCFHSVKCPAVAVPCRCQKRILHMFALNAAVKSAETVDQYFQLSRHPIIVQRRHKHHHICLQNVLPKFFHIVFLHPG